MSAPIISVQHLSKRYLVGHQSAERERYTALRDVIARGARNFARKTGDLLRGRQILAGDEVEEFWALKDVSFEVEQGEVLGIIGRNGAGKSTLLKILSRITEPTEGRVVLGGRVASLLEVGTGFHPELTGRENIFLNGAILGMTKREIRAKFDEIVDFAGVEKFLDTPVKRYSSGMYVRLAFAVAAHLEPEILVVDEVLAVGDAEFQKKCLGKMGEVAKGGRTVLFVSHNMAAVRALCGRCIILRAGSLVLDASSQTCIQTYLDSDRPKSDEWTRESIDVNAAIQFQEIKCVIDKIRESRRITITCRFHGTPEHDPCFIAFDIVNSHGITLMQALPSPTPFLTNQATKNPQEFEIELPPLVPGDYLITAWIGPNHTTTYDLAEECVSFEITDSPTPGRTYPHTIEHGSIVPNSRWIQ